MIETYILIVWAATASIGDKPLFVDPRPMSFAECRMMRNSNLAFYEMLRNQEVHVLCQREES